MKIVSRGSNLLSGVSFNSKPNSFLVANTQVLTTFNSKGMWVEINTVYETSAEIIAVKHEYQLENYLIRASNDDLLFPFFPKDLINFKQKYSWNSR